MTETVTMRRWDDWHLHVRQGPMMRRVIPLSTNYCTRIRVMPNTDPPITSLKRAQKYFYGITSAARGARPWNNFELQVTIKLTADITPDFIRLAAPTIKAAKFYPQNMTTNSADGLGSLYELEAVLAAMQEVGMVLCLHGEHPGSTSLSREADFLPQLVWAAERFPRLKIILEHVSSRAGVNAVLDLGSSVAGTITAHHLVLTLDDIIGGSLAPHNFCKPVAKTADDRDALLEVATSGHPSFFFGSDSAPHNRRAKENASGAAGVFTAPVAPALLAGVFDELGALSRLEAFTSLNGARFHGYQPNTGRLMLVKQSWVVPPNYDGVVPFMAGQELAWNLQPEGK